LKIKLLNGILIVDILTVALVLIINLTSLDSLRIILGLPFVLLFPGYSLVAALFPKSEKTGTLERWAMSFGISLPLAALIGLGLNYTPWGISLDTLLFFMVIFIMVTSVIALIRSKPAKLINEFEVKFPGWEGGMLGRSLTLVIVLALVSAVGILIYTVAVPRIGERFTEFYTLGLNNKAEDYPVEFEMQNGKVTGVRYSDQGQTTADVFGKVTLGIINQEQQVASYSIILKIDGQPADINYTGQNMPQLGPLNLKQGEKWEQIIGFAPAHTGENQKVEFLLFKDNGSSPDRNLVLWANAREAG
jgi:uncharacterized membrane protein